MVSGPCAEKKNPTNGSQILINNSSAGPSETREEPEPQGRRETPLLFKALLMLLSVTNFQELSWILSSEANVHAWRLVVK